jgi:hypothetical protein
MCLVDGVIEQELILDRIRHLITRHPQYRGYPSKAMAGRTPTGFQVIGQVIGRAIGDTGVFDVLGSRHLKLWSAVNHRPALLANSPRFRAVPKIVHDLMQVFVDMLQAE